MIAHQEHDRYQAHAALDRELRAFGRRRSRKS